MARPPSPQSSPASAQAIQQALALHRQGRLAEAEGLYVSVLAQRPNNFEACYFLGMLKMQQHEPARALALIETAARIKPYSPEAQATLGAVLMALARPAEALAAYDRLIKLQPRDADAFYNRGVVLTNLARHDEALASYDKALAVRRDHVSSLFNKASTLARLGQDERAHAAYDALLVIAPDHVEGLTDRGNVLAKLGRCAEALASYDRALALRPTHLNALSNRGNVLKDEGRHEEALAMYDRALVIDPRHMASLNNRGNVLIAMKREEEAVATFDRGLALAPDDPELLFNRACALERLYRFNEALADLEHSLALRPASAKALNNYGNVLAALERPGEAAESYDRALALEPNRAETHYNRGYVFMTLQRQAQAIADFERAFALDPHHPNALDSLGFAHLSVCDWKKVAEWAAPTEVALLDNGLPVGRSYPLYYFDNPAYQLTAARVFHAANLAGVRAPLPACHLARGDRLRVAYLSSDFRTHPVAYAIVELFERHDRSRFEIIGVSIALEDAGAMRSRIVQACDQFHDVTRDGERMVAERLNRLGVHIAVDLNGLTRGARLEVLARRAAPIQVAYLGYPATTGADFIDYILADATVVPFDQQPFFAEKIVHLPDCYHPNDTTRRTPAEVPTRSELGLPESAPVFCAFAQSYKISAPMFATWMRLLARVEGSVLWLSRMNDLATANLRAAAAERNIDPARLIFAPRLERMEDHLARHREATLFLDTLPYGAHSTAIDALWTGLPVITCAGSAFAGRVGGSMLKAAGLPELVTASLEEYEALAAKLATTPPMLEAVRRSLENNRTSCPLFDIDRLRRHVEAAYETMWDIHARGESPRSFSVEPIA
jgi:protein O-GlcNAc transferase